MRVHLRIANVGKEDEMLSFGHFEFEILNRHASMWKCLEAS